MKDSHQKTVTETVNPAGIKIYGSDSKSALIIEKKTSNRH